MRYFDAMQWLTKSRIVSVSGIVSRTEDTVPTGKCNFKMITVRLDDGSIGFYEAGWIRTIDSDNTKEFIGPLGSIRIIYQKDRLRNQEEGDLIDYYFLKEKTCKSINIISKRKPTEIQFDCPIDMIENNAPATLTIEEVFTSFMTAIETEKIYYSDRCRILTENGFVSILFF